MSLEDMKDLKGKKIDMRNGMPTNVEEEVPSLWDVNPKSIFDYSVLTDEERADFQEYDHKLNIIFNSSQIAIGKILNEANLKYANKKTGIFRKWLTSTGIKHRTAERLILVYRYWDELNDEKKRILEGIPISLAYKVTSPSSEKEMVEKVMSGEIKTAKMYKEQLEKLKDEREMKEAHRIEEKLIEEAQIVEGEVLDKVSIEKNENKPPKKSNKYIELLARKTQLKKQLKEFEQEMANMRKEIKDIEKEMENANNSKLFEGEY